MILLFFPALIVIVTALFAVLPLGAGEAVRACLSFAPMTVIHYWSARRPHLLPVTFVFCVGLGIDVLTHGPVGFWALMGLASAAMAHLEIGLTGQSTATGRAAVFAIAMFGLAGLSWGVASLYSGQTIDGQPMLLAALISISLYPAIAVALMPIDRLWEARRTRLFEREA